jgi:hypothetical protein
MKYLTRLAVAIYPSSWRQRYGSELGQLVEDQGSSLAVVLDVLAHAVETRWRFIVQLETGGGGPMKRWRQPIVLAMVGLVIAAPTAILVVASVLKYVLGVGTLFDALEPTMTPIVTSPVGETFLVLAPYLAFLLAALPVTRLGVSRGEGRLGVTIAVSSPLANLAVVLGSATLIVFMAVYWIAENL